jgi:prephenate dehydrogenase
MTSMSSVGRAWVLTPNATTSRDAIRDARWLAEQCGALPLVMSAAEHDRAVAVTSHLPQIVASALAAQLRDMPDSTLQLVGQSLRDMTRIAAAEPALWGDIATSNRVRWRTPSTTSRAGCKTCPSPCSLATRHVKLSLI